MDMKNQKDIINKLNSLFSLSKKEVALIKGYTGDNWSLYSYNFLKIAMKKYPQYEDKLRMCIVNIEKYYNKLRRHNLSIKKAEKVIKIIENSKLPCELILYRGIDKYILDNSCIIKTNNEELSIGDKIINLTPWSTSIDQNIADNFAVSGILEIHIPSNFPGIWLEPITLLKEEYEVLLPPGLEFEIVNIQNEFWIDPEDASYYFILKPVIKR